MTLRERFGRLMRLETVDRLPYVEFGNLLWVHGLRWVHQGLAAECDPFEHFAFDEAGNRRATSWQNVGRGLEHVEIDLHALPRFDPTTPQRYPRVRQYTHHLPIYPLEYPATWEEVVRDTRSASHLVTICLPTGFSHVSNAVGFERLLELVIDEPGWVAEMAEHFVDFISESLRRAVTTAAIDRMIARVFREAERGGYFPLLSDRYGKLLEVPLTNYEHYARAFRRANGME